MDDITRMRESVMCSNFAARILMFYKNDDKFRKGIDERYGNFPEPKELFASSMFFDMSDEFVDEWYSADQN